MMYDIILLKSRFSGKFFYIYLKISRIAIQYQYTEQCKNYTK